MSSHIERVIARVAPEQHGLVTRPQLRDAGVPTRTIDYGIAAERLVVVYRTVYRVPGAPRTWLQAVLAATMYAGPEAATAYRTAAALHGLVPNSGLIEVLVPVSRYPRAVDFAVRRTKKPYGVEIVHGIPTTTVSRTLADLSHVISLRTLEEVVDKALFRRLVIVEELESIGGRVGRLASTRSQAPVESVLETRFLRIVRESGLPLPVAQFEVRRGGILIARVDFAYPAERLVIELESYEFHSSRLALDRGAQRVKDLQAAGYLVVPFTSTDLRRPRQVISTVRRHLWERGHPDIVNI